MESQTTTNNTGENAGDGVMAGIVIGIVVCLAAAGLKSLLSNNDRRGLIAERKEDDYIKEILSGN